jgi:hypothetical protein
MNFVYFTNVFCCKKSTKMSIIKRGKDRGGERVNKETPVNYA